MKNLRYEDIRRDIEVNMYGPTEGIHGTPLGEAFDGYIKEFGVHNIHFICSLTYNLGKMHGKREERARRKRALINEEEENGRKILDTKENQLKRDIVKILDNLDAEKLKEAQVFLCSYFGGAA